MSRQKIIFHIIIWSLIAAGVILSFLIMPDRTVFTLNINPFLVIFPFLVYFIYYLLSTISARVNFSLTPVKTDRIILEGAYAKFSHPVCSNVAVFSWLIFLLFPYLNVLLSVAWITAVVYFGVKLEERMILEKKPEEPGGEEASPE